LLKEDKKTVTETLDLKIVKDYIKEANIEGVVFSGLSTAEENKIAKLKDYIREFPAKYRLEAATYLERLQASWADTREKTQTILEFEQYVDTIEELELTVKDDFINTLESFLVASEEDNNVKNLSYNVVRNLIPTTIPEYSDIMDKLETIKNQNDVEANKAL
jgi:hypothetical protein